MSFSGFDTCKNGSLVMMQILAELGASCCSKKLFDVGIEILVLVGVEALGAFGVKMAYLGSVLK